MPPDLEEVKECGILSEIESEKFWDFYNSKGWKVGSSKMVDWRSSARNWARKAGELQPKPVGKTGPLDAAEEAALREVGWYDDPVKV